MESKNEYLIVHTKDFRKYLIGDEMPTNYGVTGLLKDVVDDFLWVEEKEGVFIIQEKEISRVGTVIVEEIGGKSRIRWVPTSTNSKFKLV